MCLTLLCPSKGGLEEREWSLSSDREALVNLRIMSGVRLQRNGREVFILGGVHRLCRLAAHLYLMLPLRQMKQEPPGTRGVEGGGTL